MKKSEKILIGKDEICEVAGIGHRLFSELVASGKFPARYFGGKWRAHRDNIEDWYKINTFPAGPQPDMAGVEDEDAPAGEQG